MAVEALLMGLHVFWFIKEGYKSIDGHWSTVGLCFWTL